MNMRRLAPLMILVGLALGGCASVQNLFSTPEEIVAKRAEAYWQGIVDADFESSYRYLSPGKRAVLGEDQFVERKRRSRVDWESVEIGRVECASDSRCTVNLEIKFRAFASLPGATTMRSRSSLEQAWVKTRGNWWLAPDES